MIRRLAESLGVFILKLSSFIEARSSHHGGASSVDGVEELFQIVFADRIIQYLKWIGIPLLILVFVDIVALAFPLQVYGLLLDGCGAFIIARGVFRGVYGIYSSATGTVVTGFSREFLGISTGAVGDSSPEQIEVAATVDGIIGASIMAIGFTVQIIAILV